METHKIAQNKVMLIPLASAGTLCRRKSRLPAILLRQVGVPLHSKPRGVGHIAVLRCHVQVSDPDLHILVMNDGLQSPFSKCRLR